MKGEGFKPFRLYPLFLVLFMFLFSISTVNAESNVDLSVIPQNLANQLGIPLLAGQLICVTILLCITLFPSLILTRNRRSQEYVVVFMGFIVCGASLALGWLPLWFLVIICLIVASLWASKITGWVGGRQ